MKQPNLLRRIAIIFGALALLIGLTSPIMVSAQTTTPPPWGVPGSTFTFTGVGFKGGDKDKKNEAGEQLAFWINAPDGTVISTRHLAEKNDEGISEQPLRTRANRDGTATISWTAPTTSLVGPYTLVVHGLSSEREQVFPFTIRPQAAMTTLQHTIIPAVGQAGTEFAVTATGFEPGHVKDNPGEKIAFWVNMPDGRVIATEPRAEANDEEALAKPLRAEARHDGTVKLTWTAPKDAPAGEYSIVLHGLESQREVMIPFVIR